MYDINELLAKEPFWVEENGRYKLMAINSLGYADTLYHIELPYLPIYYKEELEELGVPYEIHHDKCLIHDPNVEEYHDITAPFMTISKGEPEPIYSSNGNPYKHTGKVPTDAMLKVAYSYYEKVFQDLKQLTLPKKQEIFDQYFEKRSKDGIVYWVDYLLNGLLSFSDVFSGEWSSKYYRIPLYSGFHDYIVISRATVKGQARITLKVPRWAVARLIGYGGENAKKHARALGVGYVKIEAES